MWIWMVNEHHQLFPICCWRRQQVIVFHQFTFTLAFSLVLLQYPERIFVVAISHIYPDNGATCTYFHSTFVRQISLVLLQPLVPSSVWYWQAFLQFRHTRQRVGVTHENAGEVKFSIFNFPKGATMMRMPPAWKIHTGSLMTKCSHHSF